MVYDGHYRVTGDEVPGKLVYVVRTARGHEVLPPAEFGAWYGWANDPGRVRLRSE